MIDYKTRAQIYKEEYGGKGNAKEKEKKDEEKENQKKEEKIRC